MTSNAGYGSIKPPHGETHSHRKLRFSDKLGYSLGHIFNDVSGGLWSGYTLLFMHGVQQMPEQEAGAMLMLGQVCGAITTPIAGLLTDKVSTKRRWHVFGTILTLLSFPLLYSVCPFCGDFSAWWKPVYYAIVILLFQSSYSIVQVTHLALIPELSKTQRDRSDLTAMRQSATVISIIVVYAVTWLVLHTKAGGDDRISPSDAVNFRVSVGNVMTKDLMTKLNFRIFHWPCQRSES